MRIARPHSRPEARAAVAAALPVGGEQALDGPPQQDGEDASRPRSGTRTRRARGRRRRSPAATRPARSPKTRRPSEAEGGHEQDAGQALRVLHRRRGCRRGRRARRRSRGRAAGGRRSAAAAARTRPRARAGSPSPRRPTSSRRPRGRSAGSSATQRSRTASPARVRARRPRRKEPDTSATLAQRPREGRSRFAGAPGAVLALPCWPDETDRSLRRSPPPSPSAACGRPPEPVDLLGAGDRLVEATRRRRRAARPVLGRREARPPHRTTSSAAASPPARPSRLRFALDIPKGARLQLACAIDPRFHDRPGVEFVVKVKRRRARGRSSGRSSSTRSPAPSTARGCPLDVDLAKHAGRGRELVLETRGYEQTGDGGARLVGRARPHRRPQGRPSSIVYLVDTLRADHTGVYGYARDDDARARRLRPGRGRLRRGGRARLVDEALGGVDPHLAAARAAPRGAAARPARRRERHDRADARRPGLGDGRRHRELGHLRRGVGVRPGLRRLRRASTATTTGAASSWAPTSWWTRPSPSSARGAGCPPSSTSTPWTPTSPTRRPPPFDRMFEPFPTEGHPARDPRTDYKEPLDRERHDRAVRRRHRVRGPRVRPLRPRAEGARPLRATRSSSSWPTTARSSSTTAAGSTAAASSTSSSASRWS